MSKFYVKVACDLDIEWSGSTAPVYRVYVNEELFTERAWLWRNHNAVEIIQIHAPSGKYVISHQLVNPRNTVMNVSNFRVLEGPGKFKNDDNVLRIL